MADRRRAAGAVTLVLLTTLALAACTSSSPAPGHTAPSTAAGSTARATTPRATTARPPATPRPTTAAESATARQVAAASGTITSRSIPGGRTRFAARPALVYLPPAARTHPHERFPLLMLLHGTQGGPTDYVTKGAIRSTLNAFAVAHGGRAPVVVMPDINGSLAADTECVRTTGGAKVEAYLQTVVPAWALAHLPVTRTRADWGIAGLSEGATCALVLGLRAPRGWGYIGDYFGLRRLTVGDTDDPAATVDQLFGGSRAAYDAHDPALLLRRHRYPKLAAWFACGTADTVVLRDQTALSALARRSLGTVHSGTVPGGHRWSTFRTIFPSALPWFWARVT